MGHDHASAAGRHRGALAVTLALSSAVLVVQFVGGLLSGSLALVADAGHTLADVVGLTLALVAIAWARRPAPSSRTFGRYRVEILAAAGNGMLLLAVAGYVLWESWQRWNEMGEVRGGLMLAVAAAGAVANAVGLLLLRRGSRESLTIRSAYLEVLGDLLGSVGVIVAAIVILTTGWDRADVVASVLIALLIIPRALSLLRDAWHVLAEGVPAGLDIDDVRRHMREVPGVVDVHDLHAWAVTSGMPVVTAHVVVSQECLSAGESGRILDDLESCLHAHFEVGHCTFQLEPPGREAGETTAHP